MLRKTFAETLFVISRSWMKASTTTSSRMETFLISIFVIAGEQRTHIFALSFPINICTIFCNVISSTGFYWTSRESSAIPECIEYGRPFGLQARDFLLYLCRGFIFYIFYIRPDLFTPVLSLHSSEPCRDISRHYY